MEMPDETRRLVFGGVNREIPFAPERLNDFRVTQTATDAKWARFRLGYPESFFLNDCFTFGGGKPAGL